MGTRSGRSARRRKFALTVMAVFAGAVVISIAPAVTALSGYNPTSTALDDSTSSVDPTSSTVDTTTPDSTADPTTTSVDPTTTSVDPTTTSVDPTTTTADTSTTTTDSTTTTTDPSTTTTVESTTTTTTPTTTTPAVNYSGAGPSASRVAIIGDSHLLNASTYVKRAFSNKYNLHYEAYPGARIGQLRPYVDAVLAANKPDVFVFEGGTNDVDHLYPTADSLADLDGTLADIAAAGVRCVGAMNVSLGTALANGNLDGGVAIDNEDTADIAAHDQPPSRWWLSDWNETSRLHPEYFYDVANPTATSDHHIHMSTAGRQWMADDFLAGAESCPGLTQQAAPK